MGYIKESNAGFSISKLCIFLFQLCVIADAVIGFDPRYYVISKGLMLAFFLAMIVKLLNEGKAYFGSTFYMILAFMILTGLSCIWAKYPSASASRFATQLQLYVLFLFMYLLFKDEESDIKKYLDALYIAGIGMAFLALYRYGLFSIIQGLRAGQRIGGAITNENVFGMVFSKAAIVAYYYYIRKDENAIRIHHILMVVIFTLFAFSSGSKKAFLMILVGILGINILEDGKSKKIKVLISSFVAIIVVYFILQMPIFATMNKRIMSLFSENNVDSSDLVRAKMINMSLELIKERPLLGHGFANFGAITGLGTYSHNNLTEILVSTGVVGLVAFYLPYIPIIRCVWKKGVFEHQFQYTLLLVLAIIYLVFGYAMVEYYDKEYWVFIGVLAALADIDLETKENRQIDGKK